MMNQLKGNMSFSAKLGPKTGILMHEKFVPRIKPLYFLSEKETTTFTKLRNLPATFTECPNHRDSFRDDVGNKLNELEVRYPGTNLKNLQIKIFVKSVSYWKDELLQRNFKRI